MTLIDQNLLRQIGKIQQDVNLLKTFDVPKKSELGGGGTPPNYDLTYLRLDASNDPVTADLDIHGVTVGQGHVVGDNNIIVGSLVLAHNMSGDRNLAIGNSALTNINYSYGNIAIGFETGKLKASGGGSSPLAGLRNGILIGHQIKPNDDNDDGEIVIGHNGIGMGANTTVIGTVNTTDIYLFGNLHADDVFYPVQAPTGSAPAYVLGGVYFDTTLSKMRIGGAVGWETCTSI